MALSPQLLQFKSSGVYRVEVDKSQVTNFTSNTIRLVPGLSKKGPVNTPVFIENSDQFLAVYGKPDRSLEKRGFFFHRSALTALEGGPILALNILNVTDETVKAATLESFISDTSHVNVLEDVEYKAVHTTDKFWSPDTDKISEETTGEAVFNFVNIGSNNISVIVRKSMNADSFKIKSRDWYGEENLPEYFNGEEYVSDYMVDVFVFSGTLDPVVLSIDPVLGAYVDSQGIKASTLESFANLSEVNLLKQFTGSIIPGFKDKEGRNLYIEDAVNFESFNTGLALGINEEVFELEEAQFKAAVNLDVISDEVSADVNFLLSHVASGTSVKEDDITVLQKVGTEYVFDYVDDGGNNSLTQLSYTDADTIFAAGDYVFYNLAQANIIDVTGDVITFDATVTDGAAFAGGTTTLTVYKAGSVATNVGYVAEGTTVAVGDYIVGTASTEVLKVANVIIDGTTYIKLTTKGAIYTAAELTDASEEVTRDIVGSVHDFTGWYKPTLLAKSQDILDTIKSITPEETINIFNGSGLAEALVDKDTILWRYLVDTFSFNSIGANYKSPLSKLCKDRQNAFAILNAPSVKAFKRSTDPYFVNQATGSFSTRLVSTGGDLTRNPENVFTLPGINDGANYCGFFGPFINFNDNGREVQVPPAAFVSNNFIAKFVDSSPYESVAGPRRGVLAGSGIKGLEYNFDKYDRDYLEPFGINPIIFKRGTGIMINANKTAQQSPKSALSSIHVRETLIEIENGLAAILAGYQFQYNNAQTRLEIKTIADGFMSSLKDAGVIHDFDNIMDESNNTPDVIDADFGILDTFVEVTKNLEIIVQRTTILNTGEIANG